METQNENLTKLLDSNTIDELNSNFEVKMLIFGQQKHLNLITEYNKKTADKNSILHQIDEKLNELEKLKNVNFAVRMFKGKDIESKIDAIQSELHDLDKMFGRQNNELRELLNKIKELEKNIRLAENNIKQLGISVAEFQEAYYQLKREIFERNLKKSLKGTVKPSQFGEEN